MVKFKVTRVALLTNRCLKYNSKMSHLNTLFMKLMKNLILIMSDECIKRDIAGYFKGLKLNSILIIGIIHV